ncbi:Zn-ribbon domain-containing protein [Natronorubrum sp. A-ect3]|uniref:Zn-ribbon domain-containing protein n=1 Tax=Natronorubrum sp. A-ect3 TaxID=3242698 RepID=UPI00359DAE2C
MPHECTNCGRTFPDGSKEMLSGCPNCGGNKFQFAPAGTTSGPTESAPSKSAASNGENAVDTSGTGNSSGTVKRAAETVRGWVSSESEQSVDHGVTDHNLSATPTEPSEQAHSDERSRSADKTPHEQPDGTWPGQENPVETDQPAETAEFSEWPETARRPENRSTAPNGESGHTQRERATFEPASPVDASSDPSNTNVGHSTHEESEDTAQADARSEVVSSADLPTDTAQHEPAATTGEPTPSTDPAGDVESQPPEHGRVVSEPSGDQPSIEELRAELNEQFESIKIVSPGQYELNLMELYNREEYIISLQEDGRYIIDVPDSWHADDGA